MEDDDAHADLYPTAFGDHGHWDLNGQWSIFRVPAHLREVDEKAYLPRVVSICPFHRNDPRLSPMEAQKLRFYNRLMREMGHQDRDVGIVTAMKRLESDVRKCYSEEFDDISSDEFVNMLVLDSCFVVELMRLHHLLELGRDGNIPRRADIRDEMDAALHHQGLADARKSASDVRSGRGFQIDHIRRDGDSFGAPCAVILRAAQTPKGNIHEQQNDQQGRAPPPSPLPRPLRQNRSFRWNRHDNLPGKLWVHEAKRLKRDGIRFRNNHENLLDKKFENRELTIPTLFIDECTGPLLRNLLAYEQCDTYVSPYFTCYAIFLNSIIDSTEDLEILQDAGIIMQSVDEDEEVVRLINSLTKELVFDLHDMDDCYIAKQIEDINSFCQSWVSKCLQTISNIDLIGIAVSLFFPSFR